MSRSEERGDRTAFRYPEERGALRTHRFHHCGHVVDAFINGGAALEPIGHSRSTLVEQNHARERCEAMEEPSDRWLLPIALDVIEERWDENKVARPVSEHLIRDVD